MTSTAPPRHVTDRAGPAPAIRVALVDDHAVLRDGLRALLATAPDIILAGEAGGLTAARRDWRSWRADVIVLDLSLGDGDGLDLLADLGTSPPAVVVLTMVDAPQAVARAVAAGVRGWVQKGRSGETLLAAVRAAARGDLWLDAAVARYAIEPARHDAESMLTPREREVVALVAAGWTSDEIGGALGMATKTVQNHRSRVLDKLGLRTSAALVRWALERGLASDRAPPG